MPLQNLLFIDTNIWLDFYRMGNPGLKLLESTQKLSDRLIVTYQLESEFKKNRQAAIVEGMKTLRDPANITFPGIFTGDETTKAIAKHLKQAEKLVKDLRNRFVQSLENPSSHDEVYKHCETIFHKGDDLTLSRDNVLANKIRRRAFRRFLHGNPPRKNNDTSIGDAINWEWMMHCVNKTGTSLVIVTRDSDYGRMDIEGKNYVNDYLREEFNESVRLSSQKRTIWLYSQLSDALKFFSVEVTQQEEAAEKELIEAENLNRLLDEAFAPDAPEPEIRAVFDRWRAFLPSRYNDSRFNSRFGSRYGQGLAHALKSICRDNSEAPPKANEPTPEKDKE